MLIGNNIRLRAPEQNDIPQWVEWLNVPEVKENLYVAYPLGIADETKWFESMIQSPMEMHPLVIEVKVGKGWQMVGNIGFNQVDWRNSIA
jgi:RimJ/RimL family protein N-acetyltransferase